MQIHETPLPGVVELAGNAFSDGRGVFLRLFDADGFREIWAGRSVIQVNHSLNVQVGGIRGMHFQRPPKADAKIVRCVSGRVFDVAVDLRPDSPTFLDWYSIELSPDKSNGIFIPEGCAHGFQVLEQQSQLIYVHSEAYAPEAEDGVAWNDPALAISWPMTPREISDRDNTRKFIGGRQAAERTFSTHTGLLESKDLQ